MSFGIDSLTLRQQVVLRPSDSISCSEGTCSSCGRRPAVDLMTMFQQLLSASWVGAGLGREVARGTPTAGVACAALHTLRGQCWSRALLTAWGQELCFVSTHEERMWTAVWRAPGVCLAMHARGGAARLCVCSLGPWPVTVAVAARP